MAVMTQLKVAAITQLMIWLTYLITETNGTVHEYVNATLVPLSDTYLFPGGIEGIFASEAAAPHKKGSFIRFESVSFTRERKSDENNDKKKWTGLIETIVFEANEIQRIGGAFVNSTAICCTPHLSVNGYCSLGEVIIDEHSDNRGWLRRIKTSFEGKTREAKLEDQSVEINSTGLYYIYFMSCNPELNGTRIKGRTVWRSAQGYLTGKMVPLMKLSAIGSVSYLVLAVVWLSRFFFFWNDITRLQCHITVVIVLGLCEMGFWFVDYAYLNSTGSRSIFITFSAATLTATKKAVSRVLLLAVSMGYGIVRPTLGRVTSKILILGMMYFISMETYGLTQNLRNINDFLGGNMIYLVFPLAYMDIRFIWWIFSALSDTLAEPQVQRNSAKVQLYGKIGIYFTVYVLLCVLSTGFQLCFYLIEQTAWQYEWMTESCWAVLEFALVVMICVLLAPSRNPTRYSYLEEIREGELAEEEIHLQVTGSE